ncbi:hypothetical protein FHS16_001605 [Paenibacillus endophyticus]|uniref:YdhG-like domain-containing protein n=1 Tax=Paenibacillus endophyticus TaxID=1294268 RepID=A0A7W5C6G2_9BACL|nr:DUF1801 domain-containing protein [Paenibacillus endophyticus]MBB3151559.1 hypothetical protein [Paenibacillus endophyticus]
MTVKRMDSDKESKNIEAGHQQVIDFLSTLEHPLKKEVEEVRKLILSVDESITEHIKWNAPSFCYNQEDRITLNLQGKGFFRIVFHCGAKVKSQPKNDRIINDKTGLLEWAANDRAIIKLTDWNDIQMKKEQLKEVAAAWLAAANK